MALEKEYRAGQGSLVRLNEAQRDLTSQQGRLALARVALRLAWHNLRTATAETLADFPEHTGMPEEGVLWDPVRVKIKTLFRGE